MSRDVVICDCYATASFLKGAIYMGKDLKGKELGAGITQRKNGAYQGRYKDRFGNVKTIYNRKLSDLRKELAIAIADNENLFSIRNEITLDEWFKKWVELYKKKSVRPNTLREYTHIYNKNISPFLGNGKINSLSSTRLPMTVDINMNVKTKLKSFCLICLTGQWKTS